MRKSVYLLAGLLLAVSEPRAAVGQHIDQFTQVGDSAEVCVKRGNRLRCQWFPLTPWDTIRLIEPDPATELALAECQEAFGVCSADLGDALRRIDSLVALPPPPPDTVEVPGDTLFVTDTLTVPCDCDTVPPPPPLEDRAVQLMISNLPDRSGAAPLDGSTLLGEVYVFAEMDPVGVDSVIFSLDGARHNKQQVSPYDFALPWNTADEVDGRHSIAAVAFGSPAGLDAASFTIDNVVEPPPPPPDTTPPPPPPPPPDTGGVAAWPLGTWPHVGAGIKVYPGTLGTRVDWSVSYHPDTSPTPTGFEVLWNGGQAETNMGWLDITMATTYADSVCVSPGAVGGPYDRSEQVCSSYGDLSR